MKHPDTAPSGDSASLILGAVLFLFLLLQVTPCYLLP